MKYIIYSISLSVILLLTGCYKDLGNYDYTDKARIEIEGIASSYRKIAMLDDSKLLIPVTIKSEYPESELRYTWTLGIVGSAIMDTISREKDLNFNIENAPVRLRPGTYNLILSVAHKTAAQQSDEFAYTSYKRTTLSVETKFSRGFYILKETADGNTDMDFVIMEDAFGKLNLPEVPTRFQVEDVLSGVLSQALGKQLEGKPQVLSQLTYQPYIDPISNLRERSHCLGITTDKTSSIMRARDMVLIQDHENNFWNPADAVGKPGRFIRSYNQFMYISSKGIYGLTTGEVALSSGRFGLPSVINGNGGSRWVAPLHDLYSLAFMMWDEANGRFFLTISQAAGAQITIYPGPSDPEAPQPNGITDDMLFMGTHYLGVDHVYAITQPKDGSERKLYSLNRVTSRPETPINWLATFPQNSKFNTATDFDVNVWDFRLLYGVSGGELYCSMLGNTVETAIGPDEHLALQGIPAGEKITYVANRFWWSRSEPNFKFNYLVVGSSKGDGNYTISMYHMVGGKPQGLPKVQFSGTGKIADVQYIAPDGGGRSDMTAPTFGAAAYGLSY